MSFTHDGNTARPLPYDDPDGHADVDAGPQALPSPPPRHPAALDMADGIVALVLVLAACGACVALAQSLPPFLLQSMDFWFEADTVREVSNMTSMHDDHSRTSVHPLFSMLAFTPVYLLTKSLSISSTQAVLLVTGLIGGLWTSALYVLLRLLGCRKLDAVVFTTLGLSSAAAIFWLPVPNTNSWGSFSIMLALILLLLTEQRRWGAGLYVVTSAFTLSFTVTNWMAGLLLTLARWPWKQAAQISINAFCLVVLLWGVQKFLFPSAEFFIGSRKEASWINHPQSGAAQNIASSFVFHTVIAPAVRFIDDDGYIQFGEDSFRLAQRLAFQFSSPGSAGPLGLLAVALWSLLLLNGLWRLVTMGEHLRFRLVLSALLAFEFCLHQVYGEETFTYSLNFIPLLLAVAALGAVGSGRRVRVVVGLAGLLALCAGINNWQQFQEARDSATHFTPQREAMTDMMGKDPERPWPRSVGHVPLATPGASEAEHAYHEPGGDFSPQTPSFGISLWLCDAQGRPVLTSQTIPLHEIRQTFAPSAYPNIPAIATNTPYYDATWSRLDATRWELRFTNHSTYTPAIVVRSVGPAGGPVTALEWNGDAMSVNDRWSLQVTPSPAGVSLGDENSDGWMTAQSAATTWQGHSGWGYARLTLPPPMPGMATEYRLVLSDSRIPMEMMHRWYKPVPQQIRLHLPDSRFQASMDAQVTHLMMGLVAGETRPGDPALFHRAWQRQGAYIVSALARSGGAHASRVLSQFLATHDFGGGAGPEADAPGLSIWALTEAADYTADHWHDQWLWPHIVRKTQRIEDMLEARAPLIEPFSIPSPYDLQHGQQVRTALLAQPSQDGLIVGRVGSEWPSYYVNAVSYRGLLAAAEFAERLGKHRQATSWRARAETLQGNWERRTLNSRPKTGISTIRFDPPHHPDFRLRDLAQPMTTLRPSDENESMATQLAHAHQALREGRPDDVWKTLRRLWDSQASPGLYTWNGPRPAAAEVADGWQYARGWHDPATVSPDYETAALLLLLQQDMLAYLDHTGTEPAVVIGAGMTTSWLPQAMSASGLALPGGSISWQWDGQAMRVTLQGPSRAIRLGPAFPPHAELLVTRTP